MVHRICTMCRDRINIRYLKEGIKALRMERYIPELEKLLDKELKK